MLDAGMRHRLPPGNRWRQRSGVRVLITVALAGLLGLGVVALGSAGSFSGTLLAGVQPAGQAAGSTAALAPQDVSAPAPAPPAPSGVIWQANPALGAAANFAGLETIPGSITIANDPQGRYGPSFRYETGPNHGVKSRAESRGMRLPDGTVYMLDSTKLGNVYYLGWRALWNPMPITRGSWIAFFQLHMDGPGPSSGGGPFALRTLGDGMLHFQLVTPKGGSTHIWSAPLSLNTWNTFVIGFRLSKSAATGWVEFWYNGVQQRFINGSMQYPAATLINSWVNTKWGVYRSGSNRGGTADAYMNHATLGRSYSDVIP